MADDNDNDDVKEDILIAGPTLDDGRQSVIRQRADDSLEFGSIGPLEEGKPLPEGSEAICIEGQGPVYKVKPFQEVGRKGPAKVSTSHYRAGWDNIFGKNKPGKA